MKYIDSEKLISEIERRLIRYDPDYTSAGSELKGLLSFVASLQQEQPEGNLEYWLEHFGMPKENIDYCITQIAQGYGACRYLEGVQHGAEAVNELAKQEQPEVELEKEIARFALNGGTGDNTPTIGETARHFYELGLNARKEETK